MYATLHPRSHFYFGRAYSAAVQGSQKKTILALHTKYKEKIPISMTTCYDYTSAVLIDKAGLDAVLVGDSYKMVVSGDDNTVPATMEEIIYHCKCVSKGISEAHIVGDMPFGSYEVSDEEAVRSAIRLMKEGKVDSIKLEGGTRVKSRVKAIVSAGIPVMGHIGLTPQTLSSLGGFKVQGNTLAKAIALVEDAKALEEVGCYALVIEGVPDKISDFITQQLTIPTIGIGAGNKTSGQILVWHDLFGLYSDRTPKFSKVFVDVGSQMMKGLQEYKKEVESRQFPGVKNTYKLKQGVWDEMKEYYHISPDPENIPILFPPDPNNGLSSSEADVPHCVAISPHKKLKKRIAIIGAGAMGSLFASRIAANSKLPSSPFDPEVWLVSSWAEHIEKVNKQGLTVEEDASVREVLSGGPVDVIFVCVKAPYTRVAAEKSRLMLTAGHPTVVVTIQNGLGNLEVIEEILSKSASTLIQGVTDQGAMLVGPGIVRNTGVGVTTIAGNPEDRGALLVTEMLSCGGMETKLNSDVEGVVWGKLIVNAAINPLTALLGVENGQLVKSERGRAILRKVIEESVKVAKARGVTLPYGNDSDKAVEKAEKVLQNTARNKSSMLTDVLRGVLPEIDSINGAIVKEGERLGVEVGLNRSLVQLVRNIYRVNEDAEQYPAYTE